MHAHWFVYLLRCHDGSLYAGISCDVNARVATHNDGRGAKYTRGRLPVSLVYLEQLPTKGDALRREAAIKRLTKVNKEALVSSYSRSTKRKRTPRRL